ncbi:hypothetical protein OIU77_002639 [Salix suchowensis]|uniref:Uncharacterized protein n=1 Tax=Salix suchowensis TaxID=1278906 RepID=A0ABQ9AWX8_9ROSI|nr:hypothetical protein OIU77_002639 [Salix suchowensis]
MWTDCTTCFESCASTAGECGCLGGAGEAGLPLMFIMALVVLGLFTVIGLFYSVLVATMVGQRIWQRHYHILAKRLLTKVSVVTCLHIFFSMLQYNFYGAVSHQLQLKNKVLLIILFSPLNLT